MFQNERDISEWKSGNKKIMDYHKRQLETPYRSTIYFEIFLSENTSLDNCKIIDIACGAGGVIRYLAKLHKSSDFLGIDLNDSFYGNFAELKNINFEVSDLYNMDNKYVNHFNGALCLQTLSWLPGYKEAVKKICDLKTDWIAMSLLGYEGKINFNIEIENYENLTPEGNFTHSWYNIYSIPLMNQYLKEEGFKKIIYKKFEIDIDLEKPDNLDMGTYTLKTMEGKRLQISGALIMPWYFIYAER